MPRIQIPRPTIVVKQADGKKISYILNENTGQPAGRLIEHADGRIDGVATPPTVTHGFDVLGIAMSDFQKVHYGRLREKGHSHESALLLLPNRR